MPVKSLLELTTAVCVKNLKGLESIGDFLPYEAMRHILLKIDSAYQLRQIELNSPQVQGETGEIWLRLIEKDFPLEYKAKAYKPQTPDKWYRVWEKYKKDHDTALQESENKLKNALAGLRQDKEKNTSRIIDRKLLPRSARMASKRMFSGPREAHSNVLAFNSGSRTKTHTGASVMRKVRREAKDIATIHGALSRPIRGPTRVGTVHKAPASMVNEYRRASQPQYRTSAVNKSPEPPSAVAEHEERATFISESEGEGDEDDLFDGHEVVRAPPKPVKKSYAQSAATSLLKRKPASGSSSTGTAGQGSSASSTVRQGTGGILSNKYKGSATKTQTTPSTSSKPSTSTESPRSQYLPRKQESPPLSAAAGPSSPPDTEALPPAASSSDLPRKRKAVNVFMRPKKRMG